MAKLVSFVTVLLLILINVVVAQDKDLVAYWNFDEGSGKIAKDIIGKHDGTFFGTPTWVQGKFGKALEFDGKTSYVIVPDAPDLAIDSNITFAVWFKPSVTINAANNGFRLISKNNDYFLLFNYPDGATGLGNLGWLIKDAAGANHVVHSKTNEWKENVWYHGAGTFDGKELKVYVNGTMETSFQWSGKSGTSKLELWIGADDFPNYFPGAIDDFRIYKRALSEADVKQAMSGPVIAVQPSKSTATTWGEIKENS